MIFYIFGAGPSFMDITKEEWDYLQDKHTMAFARVPYSSKKFEYYFSIERIEQDRSVLNYISKMGYLDTKLLLSIPESMMIAKELGFKKIIKLMKQNYYFLPSKRPWFIDEPTPPNTFQETIAKNFRQPIFRFRGQLTAAINACLILGAKEIRLCGIDLNTQYNFYENMDYLKEICKDEKTITEWEDYLNSVILKKQETDMFYYNKDFDAVKMHITEMPMTDQLKFGDRQMRGISDIIQWMDKELRNEGHNGIYITTKERKLYKDNKLRYRGIME